MTPRYSFVYVLSVWVTCGLTSTLDPGFGANGGLPNGTDRKSDRVRTEATPEECPKIYDEDLSVRVFKCCGKLVYDRLNEMCCDQTVMAKPHPMAECCGKEAFDSERQLCCGPKGRKIILNKTTLDHRCCHHGQYNPRTQRCSGQPVPKASNLSDCCIQEQTENPTAAVKNAPCVNETYDSERQLCCGPKGRKKILNKTTLDHRCCLDRQYNPKTECCCGQPVPKASNLSDCCIQEQRENPTAAVKNAPCGNETYDSERQLCCGPKGRKKILNKTTLDHRCCLDRQYNPKTECCCGQPVPKASNLSDCCIQEQRGEKEMKPDPRPICVKPLSGVCGSHCYDPSKQSCCHREQRQPFSSCSSGRYDASLYNPNELICCNGCLSPLKPWMDQCCGDTPYGLAQRGVLCCNDTLYKNGEDGQHWSVSGRPHKPAYGTSRRQFSGKHCCGSQTYDPQNEICCNGQRHPKGLNMHCCGPQAYNISDPLKKCCAGTLHNLTPDMNDSQCCGSSLKTNKTECCTSEGNEVLYKTKGGFECCNHRYYNTSLWACCSGRLSPRYKEPIQDPC